MNSNDVVNRWGSEIEDTCQPLWARTGLERYVAAGGDPLELGPDGARRLIAVLGASPIVGQWLCQDTGLGSALSATSLGRSMDRGDYDRSFSPPAAPAEDAAAFYRRLRRVRKREMTRIVARETLGLAPIEETAAEVTLLAEAAAEESLRWVESHLRALHGELVAEDGSPNRTCILGMGKLGGLELNLSSDVDLVFLYRTSKGRTTGGDGGRLDPRAYHAKLVSLVSEAMGSVTEDGFVFRVDLDLRPEGRNGDPAQPLGNALVYYQSWGQTWERAVLMKARPVAGDRQLGEEFLREVEPFVFRRSLDYTTVEDIKEMKRKIDRHVGRRLTGQDDLKLGRGGIREVEFFVQTLQLIHGGKVPEVRERNTLRALDRLAAAGLVDPDEAGGLAGCYRFLRRVEHAVQSFHFRQTQKLPSAEAELSALARRAGFREEGGTGAFLEALDDVRSEVHEAYGKLVHGASRRWEDEEPRAEEARGLLALEFEKPEAESVLRAAGFREPGRAAEGLRLLRDGPPRRHPSPRARRILEKIAPFLLQAVTEAPDPDRALLHLGEFLAASGARASYLSLLEENPATAKLLIALFGTSGFLSKYLIGHPELLDEMVLGAQPTPEKDQVRMSEDLAGAMAHCRDDEERLDTLRRFRNAEFLRVALNDLWGALDADSVGRQLSGVAEVCLEVAYRQALERLTEKYGRPREEDGSGARFAVLGLGKLGGAEIDYHSDLDVLFLYSGHGATEKQGGGAELTNGEFFARLAQRIMSALATRTREGIAFRMDARLRPSGQAGPLVSSLGAFEAYHREGSQTWEKQALVKLRPVAGDLDLGTSVRRVVDEVLYGAPPAEDPRPEIARIRERLEREVGREGGDDIDLKAGTGGLIDVEFAVQALQLLHGWRDDAVRSQNTVEALEALGSRGLVEAADDLTTGYRFLRRVEARLRILQERPTDAMPRDPTRLDELARGLGLKPGDGGDRLLEEVRCHKRRIREIYDLIFGGGPV